MKKKYLFAGIGIVLLILVAWGIKRQRFVCGDGVCHQKKEFKTGMCPQDCGTNTLLISDVEDSSQPPECRVKNIVKLANGSFSKLSPDGTQIVVSFGTNWRPYEGDPSYYFDNLYLLTFKGPCGKL